MSKRVPNHIAFIMDGNRRWARKRALPVLAGHQRGAGRIEPLVEHAAKRGIKYITFWAFSSENWERGKTEVGFLMRVFREFIKSAVVNRMMEKGVRVNVIGEWESFPKDIVEGVAEIVEKSRENSTITATFALNYGGRGEIIHAIKSFVKTETQTQELSSVQYTSIPDKLISGLDESKFSSYMYTKDLPDPDMIVRTGGEKRLSGFLPWQSVYSELHFVDTLWPDFGEKEFDEAIEEYGIRERRFGR